MAPILILTGLVYFIPGITWQPVVLIKELSQYLWLQRRLLGIVRILPSPMLSAAAFGCVDSCPRSEMAVNVRVQERVNARFTHALSKVV